MKNKPSTFLKQFFSFLTAIVKAKTMAMKSKTSAIRTRLLIFNLLRSKKVLVASAIDRKIHSITGEDYGKAIEDVDDQLNEGDEEDDYPDLRHSLFELEDEEDELVNGAGSVIEFVRKSREEGDGFSLEDEIDHVADVFIRRFHRHMRLEKE